MKTEEQIKKELASWQEDYNKAWERKDLIVWTKAINWIQALKWVLSN